MMMKQAAFAASMILCLVLALPAALGQALPYHFDPGARDEAPDLSSVPAIRFLTTNDYPPFNYRAPGGELVGFNVDLSRAICKALGIGCTIQAWPWDQAADALADNQGDALIAGLAVNADNAARFDFSRTYLMLPGRFVTLKAEARTFDPLESQGKVIAVRKGSVHDAFVRQHVPNVKVAGFDTEIEALEAVSKGAAIAYFGDALRASFWLNDHPDCCSFAGAPYFRTDLFGRGMSVAFPAGHNAVRDAVNWALVRLKRDGTLDELYLRWFPVGFY